MNEQPDQFERSVNQIGYDQLRWPHEVFIDDDARPSAEKSQNDYQRQLATKKNRKKKLPGGVKRR